MLTATHKQNLAKVLGAMGEKGDTMVAHINPWEEKLLEWFGGSGTRNPKTGLKQFNSTGADEGGPGALGGSGPDATSASGHNFGGGNVGGYGGGPGNQGGSGLGAGGGHSGQNYYSQSGGANTPGSSVPTSDPASIPAPPPQPPVTTAPMMSAAQPTLIGSQYGALPSWATASYQIGTAPTSYPVPGMNTGAGMPGTGGGAGGGAGSGAGAGGQASGSGMPAIGSPQAIASGIGTFPGGQPGQATGDAYAPYMLNVLKELGITPNPVAHQMQMNRNAASYGATAGNLSFPYPIQGAPSQGATMSPVQHQGASGGFNMIGSAPKTTLPKPTVVQPTKQAPTQTGFNMIGSRNYQSVGRGSARNQ